MRRTSLALLLVLACASSAWARELVVGHLTAGVYGLPNAVASVEWEVRERGLLITDEAYPELVMNWRTGDSTRCPNQNAFIDVRIDRDMSFPGAGPPHWEELAHHTRSVRVRAGDEHATAEEPPSIRHHGHFGSALPLSQAVPVARFRVDVHTAVEQLAVKSGRLQRFRTKETTEQRILHVAMRPRWAGSAHQGAALFRMMALAERRARALDLWKGYLRRTRLAARTAGEARRYNPGELLSIFDDLDPLVARELDDDGLEGLVTELLAEAGRASGNLVPRVPHESPEILGVSRLGFRLGEALERGRSEAAIRLPEVVSIRNTILVLLQSAEALEVEERLDALLEATGAELSALSYLWSPQDRRDLERGLRRYGKALAETERAFTRLGTGLEVELGRDPKTRNWVAIEKTPLYEKRFPESYVGSRPAIAGVVREVLTLLYNQLGKERHAVRVLIAAIGAAHEPFASLEGVALPELSDGERSFPRDLEVMVPTRSLTVDSGEVADYEIVLRNIGSRPREVVLAVGPDTLPSGWAHKVSRGRFSLEPGEARAVRYAVASPVGARLAANLRTQMTAFFADRPEAYHRLPFLTRMSVDGHRLPLPSPHWDQPDRLEVSSAGGPRTVAPGEIAEHIFLVRHFGSRRRPVTARLLSDVPEGIVAQIEPGEVDVAPGETRRFTLRLTAPLTYRSSEKLDVAVGFAYVGEETDPWKARIGTTLTFLRVPRSAPVINQALPVSYAAPSGAPVVHSILVQNDGNEADSFDVEILDRPEGWFLELPQRYVELPPHSVPVSVPLRLAAPASAHRGKMAHVRIRLTSSTHPGVVAEAPVTLIAGEGAPLTIGVVGADRPIAPGQSRPLTFRAVNRGDIPLRVRFARNESLPHPEMFEFEATPLMTVPPHGSLDLTGKVILPERSLEPGSRFRVGIAGFDAIGAQLVSVGSTVRVGERHAVELNIIEDQLRRSPGLIICPLRVTNRGTVPDQFAFLLSGQRRLWGRLSRRRVALEPGESRRLTLYVRIPVGVQPGQEAHISVQARSVRDSSARSFVDVDVTP